MAQKRFNDEFDNISLDWKHIYSLPYVVALDSKTREFQFKFLNRIIYTNKILFKMRIVDSELCSFCKEEKESLEHFFFQCKVSRSFWVSLQQFIASADISISPFSIVDIFFGVSKDSAHYLIINHLILTGKQYIYSCKYNESYQKLPFKPFLNKLKLIHNIEYNLAKSKGSLQYHLAKWNNFQMML